MALLYVAPAGFYLLIDPPMQRTRSRSVSGEPAVAKEEWEGTLARAAAALALVGCGVVGVIAAAHTLAQ